MRLLGLLRVSGFWYVTGLAIGLAWLLVRSNPSATPGYGVSDTAAAMLSIALIAPLTAAGCAWQAGRLRRGRILVRGAARSTPSIVFAAIWPVLVGGIVGLAAAFLVGIHAWPNWALAGAGAAVVVAHGVTGAWLGLSVRTVIAVPFVAMCSYVWIGFPAAMGPPVFSHLTGRISECCSIEHTYDHRSLLATGVVAAGLLLAGIVAMTAPDAIRSVGIWVMLVGLSVVAGIAIVGPTRTHTVIQPRTDALVCRSSPVRVCVWPEHRSALPTLDTVAADLGTRWSTYGVWHPITFMEYRSNAALGFGYDAAWSDLVVRKSLVRSYLPDYSACYRTGTMTARQNASLQIALEQATGWLFTVSGVPASALSSENVRPQVWTTVEPVLKKSASAQGRWYSQRVNTLLRCASATK